MEPNEALDGVMELLVDRLGLGRWTVLHFSVGLFAHGITAIQIMAGAFMAPVMSHTCKLPHAAHNLSDPSETFHRIPENECAYIVNGSRGEEQRPCTEWDFDNSSFASTITSEFSLVCGQAYLVPFYQSLYMMGCGIGSLLGGIPSDKLGRRPVVIVCIILYLVVAAVSSWLPSLPLIYLARFILGILHMVSLQTAYVLVMEVVPSWLRAVAGITVVLPWAVAIIMFSGLGYLCNEWRELQMVSTLPLLVFLPLFVLINESPRWLMVQGKQEAVLQVLNRVAAWHKVVLPPDHLDRLNEEIIRMEIGKQKIEEKKQTGQKLRNKILDLLVLFRTPKLRTHTLVLCLCFFTASGVYFSLSLGAVNYSADPYIYMAVSGLVEIPPYILMGPLVACVGRKRPAIGSFLFTGVVLFILPFIQTDMWELNMVVALLAKMTISAVFVELFLYSSEIFPTEVRIQGLSTGLLASRCGSILSPFFNDLLVPVYPLAMPLVVGGLCIVTSLSSCLLPETKGTKLPNLV